MSWRRLWLNLHLALALTGGLLVSIIAATGSLNVYFFEIDEWLNPELVANPAAGPKRSLDEIAGALVTRFPGAKGAWRFEMPRHERGVLHAWYSPPEDKSQDAPDAPQADGDLSAPLVSIDPYTAKIVATRDFYNDTFVGFNYKLHMTLLLPVEPGQTLAGLLAGGLMASIATGLYLWWPRAGSWRWAFRLKRQAGGDRRLLDIHRLLGLAVSPVLLIVAFTGFYFVFGEIVNPAIAALLPLDRDDTGELSSTPTPGQQPISIKAAVETADRMFPGAELRVISWPLAGDGVIVVSKRQANEANRTFPQSKVFIDRWSGSVLAERDPGRAAAGDRLVGLMYPLHNGEALGETGRALVFAAGLAPLALLVTGLARWLRKRRDRKSARR